METRSSMSRSLHTNRDLEKLEPYEGKPSRTVLRGEEGSNVLDLPDRYTNNQLRGDGKSSCFSNGCRKEDRCTYRHKRQSGCAWISRELYNLRQPVGESPDAGGSNAEKGHGTDAAYPASYRYMPTKNDGCLPYNGQRDSLSRYKKQSPAGEHWT